MNHEQRIHLLRLACAEDRLELALATRPSPPTLAARLLRGVDVEPWLNVANGVIGPFLPRKIRLLLAAAKALSRTRAP